MSHEQTGSMIVDQGRTPAQWVEVLAARGIEISERTIREKANKLGARHKVGQMMLITPEQFDAILMEDTPCRSKSIAEENTGGPKVVSTTTAHRSQTTNDAAQAHLLRKVQGNGARSKRTGKGVVTSLERKTS